MTNEGQGRNGFSRADLLWGMFTTQASDDTRDQLAASLGFDRLEEDKQQEDITKPQHTAKSSSFDQVVDTRVSKIDASGEQQDEATTSKNAAYFRVTNRQVSQQQEGSEANDLDQLPQWFSDARPTILEEVETRIPHCHQVVPLHTELMRWSRVEPFLRKVLGAKVSGSQIDEKQLVKQVASGQTIRHIPKKQRSHWAESLRVLVDINEENFPYRADFLHLRDKLLEVRGSEGLELHYIYDEPGGHIVRYEQYREFIEPWSDPDNATPLLILSDLGMQAQSRTALYGWLVFGQLLMAKGIRPCVLMPVAERDIDKRLLRYFDCYIWDGRSDLKRVKGAYQAEKDKRNHSESIDTLLSYFFATLRVDGGLLRSIRYLLPGERLSHQTHNFKVFDIGHETAIWQHRDTVHEGDEWGWQANSRENYQDKAVTLLKQLSGKKRKTLVELIGRYHALLPDELYFEAMYNLMLLEGLDNTGTLKGMVPETVQKETERYLQDLVKTYSLNSDNGLLGSWVKRHLLRNQAEGLRGQYDFWLAFMAYSHLHEEQQDDSAQVAYPDFLSEEELAKILLYINHAKAYRQYELRQQGETLVLRLKDNEDRAQTSEDSDWGGDFQSGALLLTLSLNDERIFHIHTDRNNNKKLISINLEKIKDGFDFSSTGAHEFQIGRERLTIDVSAAQQKKEPWMRSGISSGGSGLSVESQAVNDDRYRWYWHPPQWSQEVGLLPGVWYCEPVLMWEQSSRVTNNDYGRDEYGIYQDCSIAGITQRFRWIEPTTFQMGSPETEEGHLDNETQHQVTLSQGYWLADTTCTQALWQAVMGDNPSQFKDEGNPVEKVSWDDTKEFLDRLNKQHPGLALRLPTEAEWENACRAGTTTAFYFGEKDDLTLEKVNYSGEWDNHNFDGETQLVTNYPANSWGLHQMHGNVLEWCQDFYKEFSAESVIDPQGSEADDNRVLRGGSWISVGEYCRSAFRNYGSPSDRDLYIGFRLVRDHEQPPIRSGRVGQQQLGERMVDLLILEGHAREREKIMKKYR